MKTNAWLSNIITKGISSFELKGIITNLDNMAQWLVNIFVHVDLLSYIILPAVCITGYINH